MDNDRWNKMESLIEQALELPPEDRTKFLRQQCGADEELREEIEFLLKYGDKAFSFVQDLANKKNLHLLNLLQAREDDFHDDDLKLVDTYIAHYHITEKLGSGGMGVVYKAFDTRLERIVALKFLPSYTRVGIKDKERFLREAKVAAAINHPNICHVHSFNEYEGRIFIEMEYIKGSTLREKLLTSSIRMEVVIQYGKQISEALSAAHEKGIVHRDIKPENIMVDENDRIKIMDFGLAKLKGSQNLTEKGGILGTVAYMSPEQVRGEELDVRSDLFSLGIILYEMITGVHPFREEYDQATVYKLLYENPPSPSTLRPGIPFGLEDIVSRCLEKDRELRYSTAGDILRELSGEESWPISLAFSKVMRSHRHILPARYTINHKSVLWTAALVLLASLLVLFFYYPRFVEVGFRDQLPDEKHIVVLPFNNLSEDVISPLMNDGIIEVLVSRITQMEKYKGSLWVVPVSEVREHQVTSVSQAVRVFGVNLAVTGSMQQIDEQLHLIVNLIDARTYRQLHSRELNFEISRLTAIQDHLHLALAGMLELELEPETEKFILAGGSEDPVAFRLYLDGIGYLSRYEDEERINAAIRKFEESVERDPGFIQAYARLGEAYWRKFDLTRETQWSQYALRYGQKALELNSEVAEVYFTLAVIYNGMGRFSDAMDMLRQLELHHGHDYASLIELGQAYEGLGRLDQAEAMYLRAIEKRKTFWGSYNNLGVFYYLTGRLEEAVTQFKKVTDLTPDNIRGYNNLGAALFHLYYYDEALVQFEHSLTVRPNEVALSNLGTLYFFTENYPEAIRMYEQAIEVGRDNYIIWTNLAAAYFWTGEEPEKVIVTALKAIELAEELLEITPNDPLLLTHLARNYVQTGDLNQANDMLDQLTSMNIQAPEIMVLIAEVYEELDERNKALYWAEKALTYGFRLQTMKKMRSLYYLLSDPRMQPVMHRFQNE